MQCNNFLSQYDKIHFSYSISSEVYLEFQKKAAERINLPAAVLRLVVNYIVIYDFCGSAADHNCAQNNVNKENNSRQ